MFFSGRNRWSISWQATLAVVFSMVLICAVPGCGGCQPEDPIAKKKREQEEEKKKKQKEKEKPKPDYELTKVVTFPAEISEKSASLNFVKPGHWVTANQLARANNFDFQADMISQLVDTNNRPIDVERTKFQMVLSRPAPLPKGQTKHFEVVVPIGRVPRIDTDNIEQDPKVNLKNTLRAAHGGKLAFESAGEPLSMMPDHQFFLVVLAANPEKFNFLRRLSSISPPNANYSASQQTAHYRVLLPNIERLPVAPLPSHPLTWTTIAYLLWDGAKPNRLSPDQQQALIDWLHWGGQLIISGPTSLDDLKGSFLEAYLPAEKVESAEFTADDFDAVNEHWSLRRAALTKGATVTFNKTMLGAKLKRHPAAEFVPKTGEMVIERRIGAGRIVVTAFPLGDSRIVTWQNFDNFFNACLLRRPPREFYSSASLLTAGVRWSGVGDVTADDPRLISTVRFFTRDIGQLTFDAEQAVLSISQNAATAPSNNSGIRIPFPNSPRNEAPKPAYGSHPKLDDWRFSGYGYVRDYGVAGWNDFSGAGVVARSSLSKAAGITVPEASFVMRVLWIYLIVLVPVNWTVFRLIGRVEWAWIAAPIIAVVGAVMVVRGAQLDIGFVRSRTELGVLELQGGFDRGHLTRYTALYTSLSTAYSLLFDDESAISLPFSESSNETKKIASSSRTVSFRRDRNVHIEDFQVDSNSTGMMHSEQFVKLGGALTLLGSDDDGWQLKNDSTLTIRSVGLIRRTVDENVQQAAWVGDVAPQSITPVRFVRMASKDLFFEQWDDSPVMRRAEESKGEVNLSEMARLAVDRLALQRGDVRLIGYCDESLQKLTDIRISPAIAQVLTRTLVLCHLQRGPLPLPVSDKNHRKEFDDTVEDTESNDRTD